MYINIDKNEQQILEQDRLIKNIFIKAQVVL